MKNVKVIAVDLDGTLTLIDTLHESILSIVQTSPLMIFNFPLWLTKGPAFFKAKIAENSQLDVTTLPYNEPLIHWLKTEKDKGKKIVLCTAANDHIAKEVSKYLQIFDDVIASDINTNLKRVNKRKALVERFGERGYDYAGNSSDDIEVWAESCNAIVVNASTIVKIQASKVATISLTFPAASIGFSDWSRALRAHQWLKNILLFVPILAAHQFGNIQSLITVALGFISFSLCASSVYVINDLLDLESDRKHPRKRDRLFASGKLSTAIGISILPILVGASFTIGFLVGAEFLTVLLLYLFATTVYSLLLKRFVIVDCLTLAMLYTLRIIAGAIATSISLSFWLIAFSVFIFLSLALVKRYAELIMQINAGNKHTPGRGYEISDASLLQTLGVSAGYLSVLVIAFYMVSEDVMTLYAQPTAIWFTIPLFLFWISWVWLKASRGKMHDDPIVFAIKDKASLVVAGLMLVIFVFAANGMDGKW